MVVEDAQKRRTPASARFWLQPPQLLLLALVLVLGGALGYGVRARQVPGAESADAGFARDMSEHHRQAVEMSKPVCDRSDDDLIPLWPKTS